MHILCYRAFYIFDVCFILLVDYWNISITNWRSCKLKCCIFWRPLQTQCQSGISRLSRRLGEPDKPPSISDVLPTPEVDEGDKEISDPIAMTPVSPGDTERELTPKETALQDSVVTGRLGEGDLHPGDFDGNRKEDQSVPTVLEKCEAFEDKNLSSLPTPPDVESRSVFSMLQSSSSRSSRTVSTDSNNSQTESESSGPPPGQESVFNIFNREQSRVEYKVQDVNLFSRSRPPAGNVQKDLNNARNNGVHWSEWGWVGREATGGNTTHPIPTPYPTLISLLLLYNLPTKAHPSAAPPRGRREENPRP